MAEPIVLQAPVQVIVEQPGREPCSRCGGPQCVTLKVWATGWMVGGVIGTTRSGYRHDSDCPALRCEHGISWAEDCDTCEAE